MVFTTKAQRKALKKLFDRTPIKPYQRGNILMLDWCYTDEFPISYREFRKYHVYPTFKMDGAVTVPWCNMWLAIEADGYTHS